MPKHKYLITNRVSKAEQLWDGAEMVAKVGTKYTTLYWLGGMYIVETNSKYTVLRFKTTTRFVKFKKALKFFDKCVKEQAKELEQ